MFQDGKLRILILKFYKMKIALLTDGIWPYIIGGMQKHSYLLSKYLAKNKVGVVVFHPKTERYSEQKHKELFNCEELEYIEWIEVPVSKKYSFPGHYLYEEWLYSKHCFNRLNERNDIDFIYAKGLTGWYSLQHKSQIPAKLGIKIHGYEFLQIQANARERWNAWLLKMPFRFLHKKADYIFSYGGNITRYIKSLDVPEEKIVEIPGAVEANWLRNPTDIQPGGIRKLFFIGRYERRKGIEEINRALTEIGEPAQFEFHFAGPIPENLKIQFPHITYHGQLTSREQITHLMDQMDVLVCPSYSEGMPNVIMEGMSRGCAVIATDVGAVPLLVDNENGWLIQPASVPELRKAISNAIQYDQGKLTSLRKASIERISKHFTWDIIINKTMEFFNRLS